MMRNLRSLSGVDLPLEAAFAEDFKRSWLKDVCRLQHLLSLRIIGEHKLSFDDLFVVGRSCLNIEYLLLWDVKGEPSAEIYGPQTFFLPRLEELDIGCCDGVQRSGLILFLNAVQGTIKRFRIESSDGVTTADVLLALQECSISPHLLRLYIGYISWDEEDKLPNADFLRAFPALRKIELHSHWPDTALRYACQALHLVTAIKENMDGLSLATGLVVWNSVHPGEKDLTLNTDALKEEDKTQIEVSKSEIAQHLLTQLAVSL